MTDHMDEGFRDFYAGNDFTDEQKRMMPAWFEIQDASETLVATPPLDEIGGAGTLEIAKILTRFEDQIDDEWRKDLIQLGAGLLKQMHEYKKG